MHDARKGYSLIELLVAIAILLLLTGGLLASYATYNQNQTLRQAALTVKANFRLAQSKALSGVKPTSGCTLLEGYNVSFTQSTYSLQAQCDPQGLVGIKTDLALPSELVFSPVPSSFTFGVLTNGLLDITNSVPINFTGFGKTYQIAVSVNGDIADNGFQ